MTNVDSLEAYANELANARDDEETKSVDSLDYRQRFEDNKSGRDPSQADPTLGVKNFDSAQSKKTSGSRRSVATINSTAYQQVRLDNLILISKGMTERMFSDLENFFLKPDGQ